MCNVVDGVSNNFAKDCVLLVQVRASLLGDEELAAICVRLVLICTGHYSPAKGFQLKAGKASIKQHLTF